MILHSCKPCCVFLDATFYRPFLSTMDAANLGHKTMGSAARMQREAYKGTFPPKWRRVFGANATLIGMIQYCVRLLVL